MLTCSKKLSNIILIFFLIKKYYNYNYFYKIKYNLYFFLFKKKFTVLISFFKLKKLIIVINYHILLKLKENLTFKFSRFFNNNINFKY
jgi:hypothetical protein